MTIVMVFIVEVKERLRLNISDPELTQYQFFLTIF